MLPMRISLLVACSQILLLLCWGDVALAMPLFSADAVLEVELRGPIGSTIRDKRKRQERPFTISVDGESWPVEVRVRGKSRVEECRFPPLRLDFRRDVVSGGLFAGLDKVKLVTHCRDAAHYNANLFEEYAAYRMFSLVSEFSHRVRLMRIRYVDTAKPDKDPLVRHAFALEPIEFVAKRMKAEVHEVPHVVKSRLAVEQASLVFVYHYMIANPDWSLVTADGEESCCHNGTLLNKDGFNYLVPYDFDLSGFVNARYAVPDEGLPIRRVTSRLYRGYCIKGLDLGAAINAIVVGEADIMAVVSSLPDAAAKHARKRPEFLASFFELARAGGLAKHLESNCVG